MKRSPETKAAGNHRVVAIPKWKRGYYLLLCTYTLPWTTVHIPTIIN
jgi:hypothetical protein